MTSDIEKLLIEGSKNALTSDLNDLTKPLLVRGVASRKAIIKCKSQNRDFYYMDTGYFGNFVNKENPVGKKIYHRVVKNELQHISIRPAPEKRWLDLVSNDKRLLFPGWKKEGKNILLIVPNNKSCKFYGEELSYWLDQTLRSIKTYTNRPIVIRKKLSRSNRTLIDSIYNALDRDVFATVVFNSIAAIESINYGIPAFYSVPCSAGPLGLQDISKINNPFYPDPELIYKQCCNLANNQFTVDEMKNGYAWKILNETYIK
jgi:hypothetical protein